MKIGKTLDNRGMSLVELVIVMAIMAVVGGISIYGLSMISSKPLEQCAKKIEIALENHRVTAMGKSTGVGNTWMELYTGADDSVWVREHVEGSEKETRIGESTVTVYYGFGTETEIPGTLTQLTSTPLRVVFDRSSGSLSQPVTGGQVLWFVIRRGADTTTERCVKVTTLTGRVSVQ